MADPVLSTAVPRKRVEFIDLLRGWAVIVMIETHVMNIRKKIDEGHSKKLIHTMIGRGYKFE